MTLTPEQQKIRATGIGGSEVAAVAGLHPYATPLDVWTRIMGKGEKEVTEPMVLGSIMGPAIAEAYAEITGRTVTHVGKYEQTIRHQDSERYPLALATPDGRVRAGGRQSAVVAALECKRPNPLNFHRWGKPGTDDIPDEVICQAQWEAAVLCVSRTDVVAPLYKLSIYPVQYDQGLFEHLYERVEKFWRDYVVTEKPPSAAAGDTDTLKRLYPKSNGTALEPADPGTVKEIEALALAYIESSKLAKVADAAKKENGNRLRAILGECDSYVGAATKVLYRNNTAREYVDWQEMARRLAEGKIDELIQDHTKTKLGARVLRVYGPKESK